MHTKSSVCIAVIHAACFVIYWQHSWLTQRKTSQTPTTSWLHGNHSAVYQSEDILFNFFNMTTIHKGIWYVPLNLKTIMYHVGNPCISLMLSKTFFPSVCFLMRTSKRLPAQGNWMLYVCWFVCGRIRDRHAFGQWWSDNSHIVLLDGGWFLQGEKDF